MRNKCSVQICLHTACVYGAFTFNGGKKLKVCNQLCAFKVSIVQKISNVCRFHNKILDTLIEY